MIQFPIHSLTWRYICSLTQSFALLLHTVIPLSLTPCFSVLTLNAVIFYPMEMHHRSIPNKFLGMTLKKKKKLFSPLLCGCYYGVLLQP